jgi:hypothetical protein
VPATRLHLGLLERLASTDRCRDERRPDEDQAERREAGADDEGIGPEPVSEDRQPGDDRGEVRRDGRHGDDRHAVADLEAAGGCVEREDRGRDDDHAPWAEHVARPAPDIPRECLYGDIGDAEPESGRNAEQHPRLSPDALDQVREGSSSPAPTAMLSKMIIPASE